MGLKFNDDQNSLNAGAHGATMLEDIILLEKITLNHERTPARVVHAHIFSAYGIFKVYGPLGKDNKVNFLNVNDSSKKITAFVRFSTVAGLPVSTDLARDLGICGKIDTDKGNFDLAGNNIPILKLSFGKRRRAMKAQV